jgi:hypothetical protein
VGVGGEEREGEREGDTLPPYLTRCLLTLLRTSGGRATHHLHLTPSDTLAEHSSPGTPPSPDLSLSSVDTILISPVRTLRPPLASTTTSTTTTSAATASLLVAVIGVFHQEGRGVPALHPQGEHMCAYVRVYVCVCMCGFCVVLSGVYVCVYTCVGNERCSAL